MNIRYDLILGSKRTSNYLWMLMTFIGGSGFFLAGLSSYLGFQLLPFADTKEIVFIPQGIVMTFYGTTGLLLSTFLGATIYMLTSFIGVSVLLLSLKPSFADSY